MDVKLLPSGLLFALYLLLGYVSTQLHEFAHYGATRISGLDFLLGFNRWQILSESNQWQRLTVSLAGPLMTFILVFTRLLLVYFGGSVFWRRSGFLLAVFNSWITLIPHLMFFRWSGDESWISFYLGVPAC